MNTTNHTAVAVYDVERHCTVSMRYDAQRLGMVLHAQCKHKRVDNVIPDMFIARLINNQTLITIYFHYWWILLCELHSGCPSDCAQTLQSMVTSVMTLAYPKINITNEIEAFNTWPVSVG